MAGSRPPDAVDGGKTHAVNESPRARRTDMPRGGRLRSPGSARTAEGRHPSRHAWVIDIRSRYGPEGEQGPLEQRSMATDHRLRALLDLVHRPVPVPPRDGPADMAGDHRTGSVTFDLSPIFARDDRGAQRRRGQPEPADPRSIHQDLSAGHQVLGEAMFRFWSTQEMANCAIVRPSSSAMGRSLCTPVKTSDIHRSIMSARPWCPSRGCPLAGPDPAGTSR